MPLESLDPKGRHWENESLPPIPGLTPGVYVSPQITVDEFGRITAAASGGGGTGIGAQNLGVSVVGGPFGIINFTTGNITASDGGGGILNVAVSSSAAIAALDEGVVVAGGPFSALNFTGSAVTASDGGGGQLDINVASSVTDVVQWVKDSAGTAASQNIGTAISATGIVRTVSVTVTVPYSVGATLQVEDAGSNVLMASSLINAQVAGTYILETPGNTAAIANPQVVLTVAGGPGAGNSVVEVIYETP